MLPFTYFDGANTVYADPGAIYQQIMIRTDGKPNALSDLVFAVDPDTEDLAALQASWEAAEQLVVLVRDVFEMQPFDPETGKGARDEHCWKVWDLFCDHRAMMAFEQAQEEEKLLLAQTEKPAEPAPTEPAAPGTFPEKEKECFSYSNGSRKVFVDPLEMYRKVLIATRGKPNTLHEKMRMQGGTTLRESWEASAALVALVRDLFKMEPFQKANGSGATAEMCEKVWDDFSDYLLVQKKRPAISPTTSAPTEPGPVSDLPTSSSSG